MKLHLLLLPGAEDLRSSISCRRITAEPSEGTTSWTAKLFSTQAAVENDAWDEGDLVFGQHSSWDTIIIGALRHTDQSLYETTSHTRGSVPDKRCDAVISEALDVLTENGMSVAKTPRPSCLQVTIPEKYSTTCSVESELVGLHFDNLDRTPVETKKTCSSRLSINVGVEARNFCVSPISFREAYTLCEGYSTGTNGPLRPSQLAAAAVRSLQAAIFDIRIPPLAFYVAPTQNMVHDAHTVGRTTLDRTANCWVHLGFGGA